ncbi:glycine/betaine ABC transporter substrate-binding protein [Streptomyces eurocidicus]|uniref:Glycine/betaine ABC transporter substrate-binding protein n=1 Tax=Streptomyces eurocidicus TaxID=66423 RepID=A0A2N8P3H6_STREU|nr:glycine betaine ABC transporter substrate-binding protein [Streptomyces eurocidicus]MBB5117779.1 osmoprotectant transport system substrate-binding protein [Streptomyces eurocidicus]MBF6053613.1 glycine/betaine ABC transporter substrate-binding protein [Streptomyces eurocidicus]PNE35566.1 glycine/betaine ABC transporter substrate-binding protein [Streptomyces eurocidicus]
MRWRTAAAAAFAGLLLSPVALAGCGLTSGSPMVDDVRPGSVGQGLPLKGAGLTVTSKNFSENIVLGQIMGLAFEAAGADVLDRTNIQGSIGAREAIRSGGADAMYEYTGTAWITYLGNDKPIADPRAQWRAVADADVRNGIVWLPPSSLDNTYALALNRANEKKYGTRTLSDVARLSRSDPGAVTLCVESEFAARDDGLPGMAKAYGMRVPASSVRKMDGGIVYTQVSGGSSCTFGEVFTTDGRIRAMNLVVMRDDKHFFPNYNAAPEINAKAMRKYPAIKDVLDPITAKLTNDVAQELNAKVDVDGEDPHRVAKDWLVREGFIREG